VVAGLEQECGTDIVECRADDGADYEGTSVDHILWRPALHGAEDKLRIVIRPSRDWRRRRDTIFCVVVGFGVLGVSDQDADTERSSQISVNLKTRRV
jgi:hypothetical protein